MELLFSFLYYSWYLNEFNHVIQYNLQMIFKSFLTQKNGINKIHHIKFNILHFYENRSQFFWKILSHIQKKCGINMMNIHFILSFLIATQFLNNKFLNGWIWFNGFVSRSYQILLSLISICEKKWKTKFINNQAL